MAFATLVDEVPGRSGIREMPVGPVYAGLSFRFGVRCAHAELARHLEAVLAPLRSVGTADHWYSVDITSQGRIEVRVDGVRVAGARDAGNAAAWLLWHVNRAVIDASPEYLQLHAASVSMGGRALVFPGSPGSGKTTLAAALVQRGLGYLTDELVALADDDLTIVPFPKSLAFDEGSIAALWGPAGPPGHAEVVGPELPGTEKVHVVPACIRAEANAGACPARMVVAPRYLRGASTRLARLDAADALMTLVTNTVNLECHGSAGLRRLAVLAERGSCYRLEFSDLDEACRLVMAEAATCWAEEAAG